MAEEKKLSGPDFAEGVSLSEFADGGMVQGHANGEAILVARRTHASVPVANAYHSYGLLGDRHHCFARTLEGFGLPTTSIPFLKAEIDGFQGSLDSRGFPSVSSR
jgi:hypothetical protein